VMLRRTGSVAKHIFQPGTAGRGRAHRASDIGFESMTGPVTVQDAVAQRSVYVVDANMSEAAVAYVVSDTLTISGVDEWDVDATVTVRLVPQVFNSPFTFDANVSGEDLFADIVAFQSVFANFISGVERVDEFTWRLIYVDGVEYSGPGGWPPLGWGFDSSSQEGASGEVTRQSTGPGPIQFFGEGPVGPGQYVLVSSGPEYQRGVWRVLPGPWEQVAGPSALTHGTMVFVDNTLMVLDRTGTFREIPLV
jgi:hypothetical protein